MDSAARLLFMVRPHSFAFDPETAVDNHMQVKPEESDPGDAAADPVPSRPYEVRMKAMEEFDAFVAQLQKEGVAVEVLEDSIVPPKPNAVFPNNWITFHPELDLAILYPMKTESRRVERRNDIFDLLRDNRGVTFSRRVDLSFHEGQGRFLEGTGSLIFDYPNRCAYACLSERTHSEVIVELQNLLPGYRFITFRAYDGRGGPIYHTNVMMCIATEYAVICLEAIEDETEREAVRSELAASGRVIVEITREQVEAFAGNMFEVRATETPGGSSTGSSSSTTTGRLQKSILVMSSSAWRCLREDQISVLESRSHFVVGDIPTIERYGGGSVRCMLCRVA